MRSIFAALILLSFSISILINNREQRHGTSLPFDLHTGKLTVSKIIIINYHYYHHHHHHYYYYHHHHYDRLLSSLSPRAITTNAGSTSCAGLLVSPLRSLARPNKGGRSYSPNLQWLVKLLDWGPQHTLIVAC